MDVVHTIKTDNYELIIENVEGYAFCHLNVLRWTVSIYKQMILELEQIKEALGVPLLCSISGESPRVKKLVEMFGFLEIHKYENTYLMEAM